MLLIPSVAPIYPVWLAIGCRRRLPFASLATAVLLLTLSPRILRNWLVLGWPVWGRDNLGLELYTSNNDCASAAFATMMKSGCHAKTHPNANSEGAAQVRDRGEIAYNHRKLVSCVRSPVTLGPCRLALAG